jgi:broad specificity phosphatase PhoE
MPLTIYFLRHGEATHNVAARTAGDAAYTDPAHTDAPLTDTGAEQAHNTVLADAYDAIYCSPLRRCRQTLLYAMPDCQGVVLDDRLMEPQSHICNKRAEKADILVNIPESWDICDVNHVNPFGQEEDFTWRVMEFTRDMVARGYTKVLVVCHYEWIRTWFALYKKIEVSPGNCQQLVATI